jgi:hypothetical protein
VSSVHRENCMSGGLVCADFSVLVLVVGRCPLRRSFGWSA